MPSNRSMDDIDKTMDDVNEQTDNMKQIADALAAPCGASADFDEVVSRIWPSPRVCFKGLGAFLLLSCV